MPLGTKNLFEFKGHGKHKGLGRGGILYQVVVASGASAGPASAATSAGSLFAVTFDGTNDWIDVAPAVASAAGFVTSLWFKTPSTPGGVQHLTNYGAGNIRITTSDLVAGQFSDPAGVILTINATITSEPGVWHHALFAARLTGTHSAASGDFLYYQDDVLAGDAATIPASTKDFFGFTSAVRIGDSQAGTNKYDGDLAAYTFIPTWSDLTVTANRRNFITSAKAPVLQGVSGDAQGDAPWWYFNAGVSAWHVGKGSVTSPGPGTDLNGVYYDANGDFLSSAGHGASSDDMMVSLWFRRARSGTLELLYGSNAANRWDFRIAANDTLYIRWADNTGNFAILTETTETVTDTNWHHLMAAFHNETSTGGAATMEAYLDGTDVTNITANTVGTNQFSPQSRNHVVAGQGAGANLFRGSIAQFWVDNINYDLTQAAVRASFYNSGAVDLGADGSNPGAQPLIYLPNPAATVGTNAGDSGVNFTINGAPVNSDTLLNGALVSASPPVSAGQA